MSRRFVSFVLVSLVACGGDDGGDDTPLGGALTITGDVIDFQTGAAVAAGATVVPSGITPAPIITTQASMFSITGVPENSVFQLLASATGYRPTFSQVITVTSDDVSGVKAPVVKSSYIDGIATAFNVTATAAKGIVLVKLVDANGNPRAGIPGSQLRLPGSTTGPFFLDAQGNAATTAQASSASGLVVWFEVLPGITEIEQGVNATITIDMATSPVVAGTVSLADAKVTDGAPPALPTNVSFSTTVFPIFKARGCIACHSGNGPGRDLGGLTLDGSANLVFKELVQEKPGRVVVAAPATSLVLTKPLREEPPNHQNATFASTSDPDYAKIFVWIKEGAKDN